MNKKEINKLNLVENTNKINQIIVINRLKFLEILNEFSKIQDIQELKIKLKELKLVINSINKDRTEISDNNSNTDKIEIDYNFLINEINFIENVFNLEKAKYYINRLKKVLTEIKTNGINDINLNRWKEYNEIITDSLWIFEKRDTSGAHLGWYWGNFIPQIPRQLMLRYTKKGEWVLDPFVGSGTTLIECRKLGRNGIGIELNSEVAEKAKNLINKEPNKYNIKTDIIIGDSTELNFNQILGKIGIKNVQLLIMHPPYYDIIKFSNNPKDLSNCRSINEFLKMFKKVVENTYDILENGRYLALVIGDKYSKGEWIPLGFYTMQEVLKVGYKLKSIVVKNFEETRAKRNQQKLWRYRALLGGFYIFKHEYIFLFTKNS